jgi:hypothetical protein
MLAMPVQREWTGSGQKSQHAFRRHIGQHDNSHRPTKKLENLSIIAHALAHRLFQVKIQRHRL